MKILVTGASGYLGVGIVKQLCDDGITVIAGCHSEVNGIDPRAETRICDIFQLDDPYDYFGKPDVLLHLAWRNGFIHNSPSHIEDLPGHYRFIKMMIDGGCKHIAVLGTMHEVGFYEGSIKEETPTHPESLYGISKDALRNIVKLLCESANATYQWLRGYYIVGNSERGSSIFSKLTEAEKRGDELFPFTMGENQWDFIEYDYFCEQVAACVEQKAIDGIINICNGRPERLVDRVERFIKENGYRIKLDYGKYPDRPYDSKAVWGDDGKIKAIMLGYQGGFNEGC